MNLLPDIQGSVAFGRFQVSPQRRELLADNVPIRIGGRAFDLLMALIEGRGAVVSKDELLARVWPDRVVSETNLQTQVLALRQAFGADRDLIRTVAGRGYQFTGEIHVISPATEKRAAAALPADADEDFPAPTNLPLPVSELIDRDDEVDEISSLVRAGRLVTLTGAGGIGKTRLALTVGRRLLQRFPDGVWLAELSPLSDPGLVPATVAAAIGLNLAAGEVSAQGVAQALAARRLLVVLDTCEHVIDAAATMAEAMLRAASAVHVVATSQEPLRAEGEQLYHVPPLAVPAEDAEDHAAYGAVRLFVERARASEPDMAPDRRRTARIAAICRRLDGIPLAIEMAAARSAALGVEELAGRLDDRFQLLTGGRRTALPRHQTLRATLDWSHELLSEPERMLLRRLAVFVGPFSLEAAGAVASSAEMASRDVVDVLSSLVAKSLVVAEVDASVPRYRLLDTTRDYALEKLVQSGERDQLSRRHAEYYRDLFQRVVPELETRLTAEWLGDHGRQIDNLRAALDWAFSPGGDADLGVALTVAAIPLWMHLSSLEECRTQVERALAALDAGASTDARCEMKLHAALGVSLIHASDATLPAIGEAWTQALEIAERLDDSEYRLRSLWGLWFAAASSGRPRIALTFAQRFSALAAARSDLNDQLIGERLMGVSQHFLGEQASARRHTEHVLAHYVPPVQKSHILRFQGDQRVTAHTFLGRILWLQGFADQAVRTAERGMDEARASGHVISLCYVLAYAACPIALWTGDLSSAEHYVQMLLELSARYSLARWRSFGRSHQGVLAVRRGDVEAGLRLLQDPDELGGVSSSFRFMVLGGLAEALSQVGRVGEGLAALEGALARADETEERWAIAELLRIKGELLLLDRGPDATAAADHFRQALDWAGRQGALSWELRAATSLARLLRDQGRAADGAAVLQPVCDRFTEGFETADVTEAQALLHTLR